MIDTHSHLNDSQFSDNIAETINRAVETGVDKVIVCGWDIDSSRKAVDLSKQYSNIYAASGIHPHDSRGWCNNWSEIICMLAADSVAIGEIGLDYYYDYEFKTAQENCFRKQLELAIELNKPVSIHSREAMTDTISILRDYPEIRGVVHFFSGSMYELKQILDMGLYIGVDGPITFRSSSDLREVLAAAPLDRLLTETDCPYLTPVPFRGKRNEPAMVRYVLDKLAEIHNINAKELEEHINTNVNTLFGI